MITTLDRDATLAHLPWPGLLDALTAMMLNRRAGRTQAPQRLAMPLPGGVLLAMPACDGEFVTTKLVTVHPGNPDRGLPSLHSDVTLMRADTGERLLLLDGRAVTERRTAAVSMLALRTLSSALPESALIVGAGAQARAHVDALRAVFGVRRFSIAARSATSAQRWIAELRAEGLDATPATDLAREAARHRTIVLATTASAAVIPDTVSDDAFVIAVGAYRPDMCELPASLVRRGRVIVDDLEGARDEAGDLLQGGVDWVAVTELAEWLAGARASPPPHAASDHAFPEGVLPDKAPPHPLLPPDGPVVFKSVGQALWDLAACRLALACGALGDAAGTP